MSEPERYWGRFEDMCDDVVGSPSDIEFGSHGLFVQACHYDAAIRERDEARAELENERAMRAGEHDDTHSRIEKLHAELVEARAELAKWKQSFVGHLYVPTADYAEMVKARNERDALRAAVEKCNGALGCNAYALLYPSAAPAASEPPLPDPFDKRYSAEAVVREIDCPTCGQAHEGEAADSLRERLQQIDAPEGDIK